MIYESLFGMLPEGEVRKYTIYNAKGEYAELLDYGASLHSLYVLDRDGAVDDVLLGAADAASLKERCLEGSVIGRCANRIAFGKYCIDDREIQLECNSGEHFLHGGSGNYAHKLFGTVVYENENAVEFTLKDIGEGGFDCEVDVTIRYSFTDDSVLQIEYIMVPHGDTVLCPTNHAYFNLSGGDVREHELLINAQSYAVAGESGMPEGVTALVVGTPLDFRKMRKIGEAMNTAEDGFFNPHYIAYDHPFLLDKDNDKPAAVLKSSVSGREMHVFTDMPCIILFTPVSKVPRIGKNGRLYDGYCGVCLETQFVPNAVNCQSFQSPLFRKEKKLYSKTNIVFLQEKNIMEINSREQHAGREKREWREYEEQARARTGS